MTRRMQREALLQYVRLSRASLPGVVPHEVVRLKRVSWCKIQMGKNVIPYLASCLWILQLLPRFKKKRKEALSQYNLHLWILPQNSSHNTQHNKKWMTDQTWSCVSMNEGHNGYTEHSGISDKADIAVHTLYNLGCAVSSFSVSLYRSLSNDYDYKRARQL